MIQRLRCWLGLHRPYLDDAGDVRCRLCGRLTAFKRCGGCRARLTPEEQRYYTASCERCESRWLAESMEG